jgi:hypothetical protein
MVEYETILVVVDVENSNIFLYTVQYQPGAEIKKSFQFAFKEFAKTSAGKKHIKEHGANWGKGILAIPIETLNQLGIISVKPLNDGNKIMVNYNKPILN